MDHDDCEEMYDLANSVEIQTRRSYERQRPFVSQGRAGSQADIWPWEAPGLSRPGGKLWNGEERDVRRRDWPIPALCCLSRPPGGLVLASWSHGSFPVMSHRGCMFRWKTWRSAISQSRPTPQRHRERLGRAFATVDKSILTLHSIDSVLMRQPIVPTNSIAAHEIRRSILGSDISLNGSTCPSFASLETCATPTLPCIAPDRSMAGHLFAPVPMVPAQLKCEAHLTGGRAGP